MPPPLSRPSTKVNLLLFDDDIEEMRRIYGRGWTAEVRRLVEAHVREHKERSCLTPSTT